MLPGLIWKPFWSPRLRRTHNFPFSTEADLSAAGPARPGPLHFVGIASEMQGIIFFFNSFGFQTKYNSVLHHKACVANSTEQQPESSAADKSNFLHGSHSNLSPAFSCLVRGGVICGSSWNEGEHQVELPDCTERHQEPVSAASLFSLPFLVNLHPLRPFLVVAAAAPT